MRLPKFQINHVEFITFKNLWICSALILLTQKVLLIFYFFSFVFVALNSFPGFRIQYWPKAWNCLLYGIYFFCPSIMNKRCINVLTLLSNPSTLCVSMCVCFMESVRALINNPIWPFVSVYGLYFIYFNSVWKVRLGAAITRCELLASVLVSLGWVQLVRC